MTLELILLKFKEHEIEIPPLQVNRNGDFQFTINGKRNSTAIFSIKHFGDSMYVEVWFGKNDSDSGGLTLQAAANNLDNMLKLHRRFMFSGRRKVLRNYKRLK